MNEVTPFQGLHCANCGEPLQGAFCHRCGQSVHSVLKPMHGMVEETVETLLHIDGRIVHTLPRLYLKPGLLTLEYFAGRRIRYIAPFRLMFVLCLLAFFALHGSLDSLATHGDLVHIQSQTGDDPFREARSAAQVRAILDDHLLALDTARNIAGLPQVGREQLDSAAQALRHLANRHLTELGAPALPVGSSGTTGHTAPGTQTLPAATTAPRRETEPALHVRWLPDVINARLNVLAQHIRDNWQTLQHGDANARHQAQQRMIDGIFGILPQALFLMIPLFAVLLKLFYLFQRRLYMEHLIVALHSHAFLFLSLLLGTGLKWLATGLIPHAHGLAPVFNLLGWALLLWVPIYLLLMQKRIYRQSWPMSVLKFLCIGWFYLWMLLCVLVIAIVLGLAH